VTRRRQRGTRLRAVCRACSTCRAAWHAAVRHPHLPGAARVVDAAARRAAALRGVKRDALGKRQRVNGRLLVRPGSGARGVGRRAWCGVRACVGGMAASMQHVAGDRRAAAQPTRPPPHLAVKAPHGRRRSDGAVQQVRVLCVQARKTQAAALRAQSARQPGWWLGSRDAPQQPAAAVRAPAPSTPHLEPHPGGEHAPIAGGTHAAANGSAAACEAEHHQQQQCVPFSLPC
jgi:hypothetical protein